MGNKTFFLKKSEFYYKIKKKEWRIFYFDQEKLLYIQLFNK